MIFLGIGLKKTIKKVFKELKDKTCVRFKQRVDEEDYIKFKSSSDEECSSFIGNVGGKQTVYIKLIKYLINLLH